MTKQIDSNLAGMEVIVTYGENIEALTETISRRKQMEYEPGNGPNAWAGVSGVVLAAYMTKDGPQATVQLIDGTTREFYVPHLRLVGGAA